MKHKINEKLNRAWIGFSAVGILFWVGLSPANADPSFTDATASAQISHKISTNPHWNTGGGAAWIDIDNDGFQDLYVPNPEAASSWLYHNNGDGTFTEIAESAGVQNRLFPSTGAVAADFDGDGCDDLFVTNGSNSRSYGTTHRNTLFHNDFCDNGTLTFTGVTKLAGLTEKYNSTVAAVGDVDKDGDLDLYVGNYIPFAETNQGGDATGCHPNQFYLNAGDGTFSEVSATAGVEVGETRCALGITMSDFDNDGDLDILVANDWGPDSLFRNLNDSIQGIPQFERATDTNYQRASNGMGIVGGDYDNDGDIDLYTASMSTDIYNPRGHVLNRNLGNGVFDNQTQAAGVADLAANTGNQGSGDPNSTNNGDLCIVGWGVSFFDADNDGFLDLYKANGRVVDASFGVTGGIECEREPNRLYVNNRTGGFSEVADSTGVDGLTDSTNCLFAGSLCFEQSRGTAVSDYDNDGDQDLFVVNLGNWSVAEIARPADFISAAAPRLYRNEAQSNGNHWLQVRLDGTQRNHRGIGAKVRLTSTSPGGVIKQLREINAGSSHSSSSSLVAHFGLPAGSVINELRVEWPRGEVSTLNQMDLDQIVTVFLPAITSFTSSSQPGTLMSIGFKNFTFNDIQDVQFNDVPVSDFYKISSDRVLVSVPKNATTGPITIKTTKGDARSELDYVAPPVVTGFTPITGNSGSILTINYANFAFSDIQDVQFNGLSAAFSNAGSGALLTVAPNGVITGPITIKTIKGDAVSQILFTVSN